MKKKLKWLIPFLALVIFAAAFLLYTGVYYHAEPAAIAAMQTDEAVTVTQTDYGYYFDGPTDDDLLVFYPGARVEETAYAPLLRLLAEQGMDVCLVKMPFRFAVFDANKADEVLARYDHANRYIGGHSLGGAVAANYAADHGGQLTGLILLAAYPTHPISDSLVMLSIYGSEDGILNREKLTDGRQFAPSRSLEYVIEGGNHAQFGNYGAQTGDGDAAISAEEQQRLTAEYILRNIP